MTMDAWYMTAELHDTEYDELIALMNEQEEK